MAAWHLTCVHIEECTTSLCMECTRHSTALADVPLLCLCRACVDQMPTLTQRLHRQAGMATRPRPTDGLFAPILDGGRVNSVHVWSHGEFGDSHGPWVTRPHSLSLSLSSRYQNPVGDTPVTQCLLSDSVLTLVNDHARPRLLWLALSCPRLVLAVLVVAGGAPTTTTAALHDGCRRARERGLRLEAHSSE